MIFILGLLDESAYDRTEPAFVEIPQIAQGFSLKKPSINLTDNELKHDSISKDDTVSNKGSVFYFLFTPENDETNKTVPSFKNISAKTPSIDEWLLKDEMHEDEKMLEKVTTTKNLSKSTVSPATTNNILPSKSNTLPTKLPSTTKKMVKKTITTTVKPPTTASSQMSNLNIDNMRHHHSEGAMEIFSKPTIASINGLLKLAGCNIYGRMYRVGKIITELSTECLECKCTEIGVSCVALPC